MSFSQLFDALVVLLTYVGIALGRVPRLRMNRATIALTGAAVLVVTHALTEDQMFKALDLGTLILIFSMMILNANLRLAGFFDLVGYRVLTIARSPRVLLALIIVAAGVLSALFLNDPVCVLFTPLVIDVTLQAKRNPIPYLLGLATAANVGSTATITGNPQNLLIGQASGIPYFTFLLHLGPVAIVGLFVCWAVIVLIYRKEFSGTITFEPFELPLPRRYQRLLWRSLVVIGLMLAAFFLGLPIASTAFVAACALLITRLKPEKMLNIDWNLLVFFSGLFIVTGAIEVSGLSAKIFEALNPVLNGGIAPLSLATAVLSNVISNVPAVLLLRSVIPTLPNPQNAWLTLAMASTLAANFTLLGSVANLIVAEEAKQQGIRLSFGAYLRVGVPITIITLMIGIIWLSITP